MIAVSLNVGGGVRLIKPAKLYTCTQKHYIHNEDGRTAPGVCGSGSVQPNHSGNVVTRIIGIHTQNSYALYSFKGSSNGSHDVIVLYRIQNSIKMSNIFIKKYALVYI